MKKKLFLMCIIGILSITSAYAKCDGGTEVTNKVGTTFCQSNAVMNWWSAAAWCRANGLHLATMYEMCPSWNGGTGRGKCSELNDVGSGFVWSSTVKGTDSAFGVYITMGEVSYFERNCNGCRDGQAFCR